MKRLVKSLLLAFSLCVIAVAVQAKSARCFTTDDGYYDCRFELTDDIGSFQISAANKPIFFVNLDGNGGADVFADFGTGRNVSLPGPYIRDKNDRACWESVATKAKVCAW